MTTTRHSTGNETGFESERAYRFEFRGVSLCALPDRALWWPDRRLLCVADLHLGKSGRLARSSGALLPPYETRETLTRLSRIVRIADPVTVVCLGDSFDDLEAVRELSTEDHDTLSVMARGRQWIWISGNHDPGLDSGDVMAGLGGGEPPGNRGFLSAKFTMGPLTFRHIANPAESCEVSAHYHPKCRVCRVRQEGDKGVFSRRRQANHPARVRTLHRRPPLPRTPVIGTHGTFGRRHPDRREGNRGSRPPR